MCEDDFLDSDASELVLAELTRREQVRAKRQNDDAATEEIDVEVALKGGKWKEMHMQLANARLKLSDRSVRVRVIIVIVSPSNSSVSQI